MNLERFDIMSNREEIEEELINLSSYLNNRFIKPDDDNNTRTSKATVKMNANALIHLLREIIINPANQNPEIRVYCQEVVTRTRNALEHPTANSIGHLANLRSEDRIPRHLSVSTAQKLSSLLQTVVGVLIFSLGFLGGISIGNPAVAVAFSYAGYRASEPLIRHSYFTSKGLQHELKERINKTQNSILKFPQR